MKNYTGISWNKQKQRWVSKVGIYDCGYYTDQIEAVKARDLAIIKHGLSYSKLQILKPKL